MSTDILRLQPDNPCAQKLRTKGAAGPGEDHLLAGSSPVWSPGLFISGVVLVGFKPTSLPRAMSSVNACGINV